ncbi:hypothetical protein Cgig2_023713 [Carnegiea gigantea]|uniref:ATPase AAA-type core domain-containing protein n=1 Tax=Carnegiea gigantea TaxID=171969 RepID=A0A9Q1KJD0_9CARY|nr:hypothetical protein Cgig2_023713 [Carnegiea gigantea]
MEMFRHGPFKMCMGATFASFGDLHKCQRAAILREARKHINCTTWNLVCDVALFAYARTILREMAEGFCRRRLILYPSKAALQMIIIRAEMVNGEKAVKRWLEKYLRPILQKWENEGTISEHSVVFIDNIAGTSRLAFIMESKEVYFRSALAKKFANMAAELRSAYEKGKIIEECIESLIQKLCGPSRDVTSESEANVLLLCCCTYMRIIAEAAGFPAGQTDDTDRVCKRLETEQPEVLYSGLVGSSSSPSGCPEIITMVPQDLLDVRECSTASCLLLGLREDGRKELLNGLLSNIPSNNEVKIFGVELSKYSDRGSLVLLKSSPLRTISGDENLNLLELVRKHPSCIFYFDKIEKAHDEVYGWLLSLLHCGVLIDKQVNEVDFRKAVVLFGSDSGNKHACAQLAGHDGEDSTMETCNKQEKETCQLKFELLCKVDRLVVFNPFAVHQLESMRSYQVEDWRHCTNDDDFSSLLHTSWSIFNKGEVSKLPVTVLDNLRANGRSTAGGSQSHSNRSVGWLPCLLPDPFGESYAHYIDGLSFV